MYDNELAAFKKWLQDRERLFDEVHLQPSDIIRLARDEGFSESTLQQWKTRLTWNSLKNSNG